MAELTEYGKAHESDEAKQNSGETVMENSTRKTIMRRYTCESTIEAGSVSKDNELTGEKSEAKRGDWIARVHSFFTPLFHLSI